MLVRKPDDEGFGLVEVIIAFFLLAIIAVSILPALVNGIRFSSQQSSVATATRQLNAIVEGLRAGGAPATCAGVQSFVTTYPATQDGRGRTITPAVSVCSTGTSIVTFTLTATSNSQQLATVSALLYSPNATPTP